MNIFQRISQRNIQFVSTQPRSHRREGMLSLMLCGILLFTLQSASALTFEGDRYLQYDQTPTGVGGRLIGTKDAGLASSTGDVVAMKLLVRVDRAGGVFSLYPKDGGDDNANDIGQIGFFTDGRIGVVEDTGCCFQFLVQTLAVNAWNTIVVTHTNGSSFWGVSANGAPVEWKSGKGSNGGNLGGNFTGFSFQGDSPTLSFLDNVVLTNLTQQTLLFSENFENTSIDNVPSLRNPQVGTWSTVLPGANYGLNVKGRRQLTGLQGSQCLELARIAEGASVQIVGAKNANSSNPGDLIAINFLIKMEQGELSLYPQDGATDIGQIGFFGSDQSGPFFNGEVAVVTASGCCWQPMTQTLSTTGWNRVSITYTNGSGVWGISVNGAPVERMNGGGSGQNVTGFKFLADLPGTTFIDQLVISNLTAGTVLFSDDFEADTIDHLPRSDSATVGTLTTILGGPNNGLIARGFPNFTGFTGSRCVELGSFTAFGSAIQANKTPSLTSLPNDVITMSFQFLLGTHSQLSIYPEDNGAVAGQIGFFGSSPGGSFTDGEVAVVTASGCCWQPLTQTIIPNAVNRAVITYTNGSGIWGVSVNGSLIEQMVGGGSGKNVTGFEIHGDLVGTMFCANLVISNRTQNTLLFADGFENALPFLPPTPASASVGTWTLYSPSSGNYNFEILNVSQSQDLPVLNLSRSGNQGTLTWAAVGFTLQENSNLSNPTNWTNVVGGSNSPVTISIGSGNKFFRLRKP